MKRISIIFFLVAISLPSFSQELKFEKVALSDSIALSNQMQQLAESCVNQELSELDLFRVQFISGHYKQAIATIEKKIRKTPREESAYLDLYQQFAKAKLSSNFSETFRQLYTKYLINSDDLQVLNLDNALVSRDGTDYYISDFDNTYENISSDTISIKTAQNLVKKYFLKTMFSSTRNIFFEEIKEDHKRRYIVNDSILIPMKDGAEISVVMVQRKGNSATKNSAILVSSIYAGTNGVGAMLSATKGYIEIGRARVGKECQY